MSCVVLMLIVVIANGKASDLLLAEGKTNN
uniref:Uncharacterized protein n=1 Tax=Arundo donax TaxID=35708 RepID=A0A0A9BC38_ARUDO